MHDVGKIIVPDNILKKPGKLTEEEFEVMKTHASVGGRVVNDVLAGVTDTEYMKFASDMAKYHHEWWDGTGYPDGLKGEEIPLSARMMAIADVLDALISERCYKAPIPFDDAILVMKGESGTHFDPKLIGILLEYRENFRAVHE
jgi:HD-GYP domain-containing protein (c-di-GMP phosphodiesterase class II)